MITWKRRLKSEELIHSEEEVEVSINPGEFDNLIFLLENVLHLELVDAVGFDPATNRGKVYSPIFVNAQNVMVGGKIKSITVEKDFDLVYNPKTGVENIAVLLMVTLVAFSLGYLVLSYRAKPVGLN